MAQATMARRSKKPYATDQQRWQALVDRDPAADGVFYILGKDDRYLLPADLPFAAGSPR